MPLTEKIIIEPEISEKSFLENSGFVGESIDAPQLEIIPDIKELLSFLRKDFENRQCARISMYSRVIDKILFLEHQRF